MSAQISKKALLKLANAPACAEARMGVGNAAALRAIGKCEILIHGLSVGLEPMAGISVCEKLDFNFKNATGRSQQRARTDDENIFPDYGPDSD